MIDPRLIEAISKSDYKGNLVQFLNQLKDEVADVRTGKHTLETRLAVIEIIDTLILNKLRPHTLEKKRDVDSYN